MFEYGLLKDAGKVSAEIAKLHAKTAFEKYRVIQDRLFMSDFDRYLLELEEQASKDKSWDDAIVRRNKSPWTYPQNGRAESRQWRSPPLLP